MLLNDVLWRLGNTTLGIGRVPALTHTKGQPHTPFSYVRVCPRCGDVWSRVVVLAVGTKYIPESRLCTKCGPGLVGTYNPEYSPPRDAVIHDLIRSKECPDYLNHLLTGGN